MEDIFNSGRDNEITDEGVFDEREDNKIIRE